LNFQKIKIFSKNEPKGQKPTFQFWSFLGVNTQEKIKKFQKFSKIRNFQNFQN